MLCPYFLAVAMILFGASAQSFTLPPNPPGPSVGVEAKCLYHTQTSVNYCAGGNVVNCARVDFQAFSYEGCDCNKTIETGVDLVMVFDQLPHQGTQQTIAESNATWNRLTIVGAVTLARTVGFSDNTIGFIRPTATGCDLFGFNNDTFMRPGDDFVNNAATFAWKDLGPCIPQAGSPPCAPKQTRHLDCVEFARNKLVSRDPLRRKIIFSLRHSPDSGTFMMKNEPENNLFYFITTAVQQGLTGDISFAAPDSVQSQFDFGNFERTNNHFVLGKAGDRFLAYTLDPTVDPDLGTGYVRCNNPIVQGFLQRDFNAEAPSQVSNMICTIFPTAPTLAWWTLDAFNIGDQTFIRGTVSAFTSWLCELNGLTSSPSLTPTSNPTKNPTTKPTQNPTPRPTGNPTKSPTNDPTSKPTSNPTQNPTRTPTDNPTARPTGKPTPSPTANPTKNPTKNPTRNPSGNPTVSPTLSPTTCQQRKVPEFPRRNCATANGCTASSAVVTVGNNNQPVSVTTNTAAGTTTVCYSLNLVNNGGTSPPPCDVTNDPMTGVSFIIDECCPAPTMEFLASVSVSSGGSSVSVNREACAEGDLTQAFNDQCTRTSRSCAANPGAMCSVLNLNNLNVLPSPSVQYCITVQGTNFDVVAPPNELDANVAGKAKFCFERGSTTPSGQANVCTCVEVGFIRSERLCNNTPSPSANPSTNPTKNPTPSPTQKPTPNPTMNPTRNPTQNPTVKPSSNPTNKPTNKPTSNPTRTPTQNPTSNPTQNPTTCLSRNIPDFTGKDCSDTTTCTGTNAIVIVTNSSVVTNQGAGTTKLCYQIALNNAAGGVCSIGNVPVRGISLVTDECCPVPDMEFLDMVSVTSPSGVAQYNRVQCPKGGVANAFDTPCARTTRVCESKPGSNCSVLNVNGLSVTGPSFEYCVTVAGTGYDVADPIGTIDPNAAGQAKICFERGSSTPLGSNICSCVEVGFIKSDRICNVTPLPTKAPTNNPTTNPTNAPTTCKQSEVPDFKRKDCTQANGCTGSSALVSVGNGGKPTATLNGDGTTTVCYDLNLVANPASPCNAAGAQALTGVSFIIDECCPTPMMEFFETVSISGGGAGSSGLSVNREACVEGNSAQTASSQCTRTSRACKSNPAQQCTVLNLNNLAITAGATAKYCIKVQGEFDVVAPAGELDPSVRGKAKFCFERGSTSPSGPTNVCTCVEVGFIESPRLCKATFRPSSSPTPSPDCLIPPVFPRSRSCKSTCSFSTSNWNISFVDRVVSTDVNGSVSTTFTYAASSLKKYSKRKSDSQSSGGRPWTRPSKKNRRRLSTWSKPSKKSVGGKQWSKSGDKPSKKASSKKSGKPSKKTSDKGSKGKPSKKLASKKSTSKPSKKLSADSGTGKPASKKTSSKKLMKPSKKQGGSNKSDGGKPSKKSPTEKPSKKTGKGGSKSNDGKPSSKKVSSKKVPGGGKPSKKTATKKSSSSKPSKKSGGGNKSDGDKPSSKKTPSKKASSGKPGSKKVSKKASKKQGASPCNAYLESWALRLDECCGVGVLKDAVASGLAKVSVNGRPCGNSYRCKIKSNGKNGDVIVVYGTKPSTLSITVPGDVELSRGGSVCAQAKSACACRPMMTPNTCLLPTRSPTSKPTMNPSPPPTRKATKVSKKGGKGSKSGSKSKLDDEKKSSGKSKKSKKDSNSKGSAKASGGKGKSKGASSKSEGKGGAKQWKASKKTYGIHN